MRRADRYGPTAVGKTALCLDIAKHFHIPVINADSRQIYRELKIGTAAPTEQQLGQVQHYFVGMLELDDYYSASIYEQQVMQLLPQLFQKSDYALMAGGSMLYIDAVCNGIDDIPTIDDKTRSLIKHRLEEEGLEALCDELHQLDPQHYAIVDKKNPRRVVHALEICHMTGRTYSSFRTNCQKPRNFRIKKIGLNMERDVLYDRINQRVDQMMSDGLLDEARRLLPKRHLNALNTVGYKEMFAYFDGTMDFVTARERIKKNTRVYAKKQITWFAKDPQVRWLL